MWEYSRFEVSRKQLRELSGAAEALSKITGEIYAVSQRGFWRKKVIRISKENVELFLTFVIGRRPLKWAMIGFTKASDRILLPTELSRDLLRVAAEFSVPKSDIFCLYSFLRWDFGVVKKKEPPRLLKDLASARDVGVEVEFSEARERFPGYEIWYQRWGGFLNCFRMSGEKIDLMNFGCLLGDYEMVPMHLLR